MLRDPACRDTDAGIARLRKIRDALPAGAPILDPVEALLVEALVTRVTDRGGGVDDVEEAGAVLTAALARMTPDHWCRTRFIEMLALQQALRFAWFEGGDEHRQAAMAHAMTCLAWPETADTGHLVTAWMALFGRLPIARRSLPRIESQRAEARLDGQAAAAMFADIGSLDIAPDDAETAISHLRRISATAQAQGTVPVLWSMALFVLAQAGRATDDAGYVAEDLLRATDQTAPGTPDHTELHSMRAALLALQSERSGRLDELRSSTAALREAAAMLPTHHPMRNAMFEMVSTTLIRQAVVAESADDKADEAEWIMQTLEQLPPDDPQYATTLSTVAMNLIAVARSNRTAVTVDRVISYLELALAHMAPPHPGRIPVEFMYRATIYLQATLDHQQQAADAAIQELIRCVSQLPEDHIFRPCAIVTLASAFVDRSFMTGELRSLELASVYLQEAFDLLEAAEDTQVTRIAYGLALHLRGLLSAASASHENGRSMPAETVSDLERAVELSRAEGTLRPRLTVARDIARALHGIDGWRHGQSSPFGDRQRDAMDQILTAAENTSHDHGDYPAFALSAASGLMLRAIAENDVRSADQAISLLAEASATPDLATRERLLLLGTHGSALLSRYGLTRVPRDLSNAIDRLEEGRRAVEQVTGSPYAADLLSSLARAYRTRADGWTAVAGASDPRQRADIDRAVTTGLAALREQAGDVFLQESDENALFAARRGTKDATEMARWFLGHGQSESAIAALELGRAMVLHAATSGTRVEEVLRDAGQTDLAGEWASRSPDEEAADDLRYRIMTSIEGSAAESRLFSAPSVADVTAALAACGADALVYLLPRGDDGAGLAILVQPDGQVRRLPLPGLYCGPRSPAAVALGARREADAGAAGADRDIARKTRQRWVEALGELCDWAWSAAIGPVLSTIPSCSPGDGRPEHRIVIIPDGELGLVPWHAARRRGGDGYRYACQDVAFSYAPSARQFADAARRRPRPWAGDPVLVSDSRPSQYETAVGIGHLYTEYYAIGSVFGYARSRLQPRVPGSAAATAADVLAALPSATCPGATLLHFGCHGQANIPVLASHLDLGEGGKVAVREILRQTRKWQSERSPDSGGLVVLAACLSDVAEDDYDEALTLATAFMSAGSAGVVAARWSVPATTTAVFMAIFHRYLNNDYPDAALALRATQLWMLDPARIVPDGLPAMLRDEASVSVLAEPEAWAGFAYQGR
jgi:hypothetical protein